jgi:hypothetical protein
MVSSPFFYFGSWIEVALKKVVIFRPQTSCWPTMLSDWNPHPFWVPAESTSNLGAKKAGKNIPARNVLVHQEISGQSTEINGVGFVCDSNYIAIRYYSTLIRHVKTDITGHNFLLNDWKRDS